jgi:hypothetical protein
MHGETIMDKETNEKIKTKYDSMPDLKPYKNPSTDSSKKNWSIFSIVLVVLFVTIIVIPLHIASIAYEKDKQYQNQMIDKIQTIDDCNTLFVMGIDYAYNQNIFNENKLVPAIIDRMTELGCK